MKNKKVILGIGAGFLVVAMAVGLAFFANSRGKAIRPEDVKRATTARKLLMESFGQFDFSEQIPEYLVGRYIDEDCKLQVRLHESARDQEAEIRKALGEYADMAEFTYVPVTYSELLERAEDIRERLEKQGYSGCNIYVEPRTGNIHVGHQDKSKIVAAATWSGEQTAYPFDNVGVELIFDNNAEVCLRSQQAEAALEAWRLAQGGYYAYRDYYCGYYISIMDGKLHVVITDKITRGQKEGIEACLEPYADAVVYEYGGYPKEETQVYVNNLMHALSDMGIGVVEASVDPYNGQPILGVLREDAHLVYELLGKGNAYPFGNEKYTVIIELCSGFIMPA